MYHEHTTARVQPLLVSLFLGASLTGCATSSQIVAPSIENYTPPALSQRGISSQEPPAGASGPSLAAQENNTSAEALTLAACVQIALDRNPVNLAARQGVVIAEETIGIARAPYYPEVAFSTGWSRSQRRSSLSGGLTKLLTSSTSSPADDWLAGFTARYTIVDGGRRAAEHRRAIALKSTAGEEAKRMRQDLVFEVHSSFYRLAAAMQVLGVAEENLSRAEAHLHLAQRLKEAGAAPKADVLRAEVEVAESRLALTRAAGLTRTTQGQLSIAMGIPAASRFEIDAGSHQASSPALPVPEKIIEEALQTRPEIKAALQQISADEAGVAAAKSAYRPRLHAEAGYNYRSSDFPPDDEEWSIGLNLNWTLFSGFSRKHELNRARAELSRQEAEAQQVILQVQQEVLAAHSAVLETWESVQTTETQVTSALESMRVARIRYEAGAATINDLLDAQTALARAETNRAEAAWDLLVAQTWLDRAKGQIHVPGS